jgi:hypothetical protein
MEAVSSPDTSEDSSTTRRQNPNEDHQMITTAVKTWKRIGGLCAKHCALTGIWQFALRIGLIMQDNHLKATFNCII